MKKYKSYKLKYKLKLSSQLQNESIAYIIADNSVQAAEKLEAEFPGMISGITLVKARMMSEDEYENG